MIDANKVYKYGNEDNKELFIAGCKCESLSESCEVPKFGSSGIFTSITVLYANINQLYWSKVLSQFVLIFLEKK